MRKQKSEGFLLTFAIVALALMSTIMFVLAGGANAMLFHANTAYLQAVERNLIASGLAWAQATISTKGAAAVGEPVELNTGAFDAPNAGLTVKITQVQADRATVRIATSCTKGRRTLRTARDYVIDLR
jgi:hypothetical protein